MNPRSRLTPLTGTASSAERTASTFEVWGRAYGLKINGGWPAPLHRAIASVRLRRYATQSRVSQPVPTGQSLLPRRPRHGRTNSAGPAEV